LVNVPTCGPGTVNLSGALVTACLSVISISETQQKLLFFSFLSFLSVNANVLHISFEMTFCNIVAVLNSYSILILFVQFEGVLYGSVLLGVFWTSFLPAMYALYLLFTNYFHLCVFIYCFSHSSVFCLSNLLLPLP
jgi:hypothetical protein